jgi:hypothetical protein
VRQLRRARDRRHADALVLRHRPRARARVGAQVDSELVDTNGS